MNVFYIAVANRAMTPPMPFEFWDSNWSIRLEHVLIRTFPLTCLLFMIHAIYFLLLQKGTINWICCHTHWFQKKTNTFQFRKASQRHRCFLRRKIPPTQGTNSITTAGQTNSKISEHILILQIMDPYVNLLYRGGGLEIYKFVATEFFRKTSYSRILTFPPFFARDSLFLLGMRFS